MERVATKKVVRTDALPGSAWRCAGYDAIVCIDVLLSATTIVTALSQGRRVFAAPNPVHARWLKSRLADALVLGDTADTPNDSIRFGGPTWLDATERTASSLVIVSPLAEMLAAPLPQASVYVACLRNLEATAKTIARRHSRVAVLGAGEGGEVCTEDQMVASWLAERLRRRGFELEGRNTTVEVERWGSPDATLVGWSRSAERLRTELADVQAQEEAARQKLDDLSRELAGLRAVTESSSKLGDAELEQLRDECRRPHLHPRSGGGQRPPQLLPDRAPDRRGRRSARAARLPSDTGATVLRRDAVEHGHRLRLGRARGRHPRLRRQQRARPRRGDGERRRRVRPGSRRRRSRSWRSRCSWPRSAGAARRRRS